MGSMGRNGNSTLASTTLDALPKFDAVVILTYFMVLPRVRRPSTTASATTVKSLSSRMRSAACLATSVAVSTQIPTSATQGAGVVDAVADEADGVPAGSQGRHDPGLLLRIDLGEDR